ncbi:MAG TPA: AAA family ATPase, partial [Arenicellales bacterium]|nr:AAA family ATPase [Arenicellales bacterium]
MITSLHIHNLAIIDKLDIEFDDGMTALTGETGAGKSIMVDALGLLLGDRGDSSVIRHGRESADLSVHLSLRRHPSATQWLEQQQLSSNDECLLRRTLHRQRGSRCWINGHPATVQMLKEFGELLVDIHSQHEHQSLNKRATQRLIVDSFSNTLDEVASLSQLYRELGDLQQRKRALEGGDEGRESRVQLLEFQLEELDQAGLVEDEITQLEDELQRLG